MKVSVVLILLSLLVSMALAMFLYLKRNDVEMISKEASIMDIKVRVTRDVLGEYKIAVDKMQKTLDDDNKDLEILGLAEKTGKTEANKKKTELEACQNNMKTIKGETAASVSEMNTINGQFAKEETGWSKEIADLKQKLEQKSKVCEFVKKDSVEGMKLCGNPIPEPLKEKAEAPKAEAPKAEAPKAEAPKAEAPKAEAPKAEAPKAEAPKAEAPKAEAPKAEAPKAEAPKAEAPKAEAPKAEAPK